MATIIPSALFRQAFSQKGPTASGQQADSNRRTALPREPNQLSRLSDKSWQKSPENAKNINDTVKISPEAKELAQASDAKNLQATAKTSYTAGANSAEAGAEISLKAEGQLYDNGKVAAGGYAKAGAEAGAGGAFESNKNGFQAEGYAGAQVKAEAALNTSAQLAKSVSVENKTTVQASAGAQAEGSAGFQNGGGTTSGNLSGGARVGAEVGVATTQTTKVGSSSASGGVQTSIGPSLGAEGGGKFEAGKGKVTIGFNVDADVVFGVGISGEVTIAEKDVKNAAKKVEKGAETAAKEAARGGEILAKGAADTGGKVLNEGSKVLSEGAKLAEQINPFKSNSQKKKKWW